MSFFDVIFSVHNYYSATLVCSGYNYVPLFGKTLSVHFVLFLALNMQLPEPLLSPSSKKKSTVKKIYISGNGTFLPQKNLINFYKLSSLKKLNT